MKYFYLIAVAFLFTACGPPKGVAVSEILKDINFYYGKTITVRTKLVSGARCNQDEVGVWKTYCKGCQYCKGPMVLDPGVKVKSAADWPMILGGTWEYKDIRCKGPLNEVECYPFKFNKTYVIRGKLENSKPPKLLLSKFWEAD
jgi:hypothetical protein